MPLPLNVTVPPLAVNVPESDQFPATFMLAAGAVRAPEMVILLNELVLEPLMAVVPLNTTVPLLFVNTPESAKLPETFIVPLGAIRVPDEIFTFEVVTVPDEPVNVPPLTVNPPLNVCVAVEALYVPPDTVVSPVTAVVCPLALYVPPLKVNAPEIISPAESVKVSEPMTNESTVAPEPKLTVLLLEGLRITTSELDMGAIPVDQLAAVLQLVEDAPFHTV